MATLSTKVEVKYIEDEHDPESNSDVRSQKSYASSRSRLMSSSNVSSFGNLAGSKKFASRMMQVS